MKLDYRTYPHRVKLILSLSAVIWGLSAYRAAWNGQWWWTVACLAAGGVLLALAVTLP